MNCDTIAYDKMIMDKPTLFVYQVRINNLFNRLLCNMAIDIALVGYIFTHLMARENMPYGKYDTLFVSYVIAVKYIYYNY